MTNFGQTIEEIRKSSSITLKQLSRDIGFDPSYISRIERGKKKPSDKFVDAFTSYFAIETGTETYKKIKDSASIARAEIPDYVMSEKDIVDRLPMLFRTITGSKIEEDALDDLINLLKSHEDKVSKTDI